MLRTGRPDFPFCLCWANHNWTWRRENKDRARLFAQEYSEEDDREHIRWMLDAFEDERYIRVNGRPLLLVYMVTSLPDPIRTFDTWRTETVKGGLPEPYILKVESLGNFQDPKDFGCDASVEFWPHGVDRLVEFRTLESGGRANQITEYEGLIRAHLSREKPPFKRYPCVVPHWDNTARFKPTGARVLHGSTPELYGRWMRGVVDRLADEPAEEQLVFINAWNEWGEGAYLEPDYRYGRAYLEANRAALESAGVLVPTAPRTKSPNGSEEEGRPSTAEELYDELQKKYARLQKRHVELMAAEEHSCLVRRLEETNETLALQLTITNERLTIANERLTIANERLYHARVDRDQLVRQMRAVNRNLSGLYGSWQWRLGQAITRIGHRLTGRLHLPAERDRLGEIVAAFQASEREREKRKKEEETSQAGSDGRVSGGTAR